MLNRVYAGVGSLILLAAAALLLVTAVGGTRECRDANYCLSNWSKEMASFSKVRQVKVRDGGTERDWYTGECSYPVNAEMQWKGDARLPALPPTNVVTIYVQTRGGEVRTEDELLLYAKQWPLKGWLGAGVLLALLGLAAGLYALGLLRRRIPMATVASSPRGAFPVG